MNDDLLLLSRLLDYPAEDGLLSSLVEARERLEAASFAPEIKAGLAEFLSWLSDTDPFVIQETYVELVDRNRRGSLYLFEHAHGESRERGGAMIDLAEFYRERGLELAKDELPDYLPAVLEFASHAPAKEGALFLRELAHLAEAIYAEHSRRGSLWSPVLAAVVDACGGSIPAARRLVPVSEPEPDIDALWQEPAVEFAGDCAPVLGAKP